MCTDAELIAARLGIDVAVVRRLQERGYLRRLDLGDEEIRARLYAAHVASIARHPSETSDVTRRAARSRSSS